MEHYTDVADIKRVLQNLPQGTPQSVNPEFLVSYFGSLSRESSLEILKDMLAKNIRQNIQVVVRIASKYSDPLGPESLIKIFEDFKCF